MSLYRVPITGWNKCLHEAALFDSAPEYRAATILDSDSSVRWWFRNEPAQLRIPTPVGYFEPDFLYSVGTASTAKMCVLEIKGEHLWNGPGSPARIKAAAGAAWARAIWEAGASVLWEFHEILGQDATSSSTLRALLDKAVERFVPPPSDRAA